MNDLIERHIKTHTECSDVDRSAVSTLEFFLRSNGHINTNFSSNDKWPNTDGAFEYISDTNLSRRPEQNFIVQIKGTHDFKEKDGVISYSLKSLGFPAYIYSEVTADPGILFIVINPSDRGKERVFWKYMSLKFLKSIDFKKNSVTIKLEKKDEIENTDDSIMNFCKKLHIISQNHSFLRKLGNKKINRSEAIKIINARCEDIDDEINILSLNYKNRDKISNKIINSLEDLCFATMILNATRYYGDLIDLKLAFEIAKQSIETKFLTIFYENILYRNSRIPEEGQSERLMLKYYNYLWELRNFLKQTFNMFILNDLDKFPLNLDTVDENYYISIAPFIEQVKYTDTKFTEYRYFIIKKTPFFVNGERYFEISLQLDGTNSTKLNRITIYTKLNILTNYSIKIRYTEVNIELLELNPSIKVVLDWKVSITPYSLNGLARFLNIETKLNQNYREYDNLMSYLKKTGITLLDLIDLTDKFYKFAIEEIYGETNTNYYQVVLDKLREKYSISNNNFGKHVIRYILLNLNDNVVNAAKQTEYNKKVLSYDLTITSKCYGFERNPCLYNFAGRKSPKANINDLIKITNDVEFVNNHLVYLTIENKLCESNNVYIKESSINSELNIRNFNASLNSYDIREGFKILNDNNLITIDSYEKDILYILKKLYELSKVSIKGQKQLNDSYLNKCGIEFSDPLKKIALSNLFVNSHIMLIYGAAGTGKTTLMNYISNLMKDSKKLFLSKTYTAIFNLKRRIENPGSDSDFKTIDSFSNSKNFNDYDIIFVDECSTIENSVMAKLLNKVGEDTLLVLAGDIYQIESIKFGNWFTYAKHIIDDSSVSVELLSTWRTEKEELRELWNEVREIKPNIIEKLSLDGPFSSDFGNDIFVRQDEEEVVLCLNYDGKFGLNNMNRYFQNANPNKEVYNWYEWSYKVGDPIIFLDTKRSSLLYNNLKGRIVAIEQNSSSIVFTLDIDRILTEIQCKYERFEFVDVFENCTRIKLDVIKIDDKKSEDEQFKTIVPFQVSYAVSIHKAQGLEYNSVKVIIPSYNEERITHSIFYTAITRAKQKLKIYWTAETMNNIISKFNEDKIDVENLAMIKKKLNLDKN